jgi:protein SCO1
MDPLRAPSPAGMMRRRAWLAAAPTWLLAAPVVAANLGATGVAGPPALAGPDFTPPPAGSYRLPAIQRAANGWVLEGDWLPRRLSRYTEGRLTLLSFVYTYCSDPQGCPLAYENFVALHTLARADPLLRGRVRLVSLSFDPGNDTPQAMQTYGGAFARGGEPRWHFLTTYSLHFLQPILEGFGQDVSIEPGPDGAAGRAYTHLLKVFLLDAQGWVREVYSTAFLHPQVLLNDLRTLALEERARARAR